MKIVILKNGQIVDSRKYDWNSETKTFSSNEDELVLDFGSLENVTIKVRNSCTINCGYYCTINCGYYCTINCGYYCTIKCGYYCTINSGNYCTINSGYSCTIRTYWNTEIVAGKNCILNYIYDGICECYKLEEKKKYKILKSGKLEQIQEKTETELQIEKLRSELNLLEQKYLQEKSGK